MPCNILDCGSPPSVALTCGHNRVNADWSSPGCEHVRCKGKLSCSNGTMPYSAEVNDYINCAIHIVMCICIVFISNRAIILKMNSKFDGLKDFGKTAKFQTPEKPSNFFVIVNIS